MMISDHASPPAMSGGTDCGGQNVYVKNLSRALADRGVSVDIFTRQDHPERPSIVHTHERVRVFYLAGGPPKKIRKEDLLPYMPEFARACTAWARLERYDIAHAHFFLSGLIALHLQEKLQLPFAITFHALGKVRRIHQGKADEFPDSRFTIEEKAVQNADRLIAECPQDAEDLICLYNADPSKVTTVPCGVDLRVFRPEAKIEARKRLGLPPDRRIVLQVGRLVPRKGIDNVLRAVAVLARYSEFRDLVVVVVGGPGEEPDRSACAELDRLMRLSEELGIRDRTVFTGQRKPDVLRYYYSAGDVFVSTPWYEPFGMTPLEAMACGTPVIGANVGGIKYSVERGNSGLLVPPRSPDALAGAIRFLMQEEEVRNRFSRAGLKRVESHFTWDNIAGQMLDVYSRAAGRKEARAKTTSVRRNAQVITFPSRTARRIIASPASRNRPAIPNPVDPFSSFLKGGLRAGRSDET